MSRATTARRAIEPFRFVRVFRSGVRGEDDAIVPMLVVRAPLSLAGDAYAHASAWLSLKRLGDLDRGRANNLNLLRFVAATLVVFSHSWPLAGAGIHDPLARRSATRLPGGLAVTVLRDERLPDRAKLRSLAELARLRVGARAARRPGVRRRGRHATFVLRPLLTTLPVADYLAARGTWTTLRRRSRSSGSSIGFPACSPAIRPRSR
jgi:hypothetical protein